MDLLAAVADGLDRSTALDFRTPGQLAQALARDTVQTPALDLIDAALVDVAAGLCKRLMVFMPPQEGKSERVSHFFALWMLLNNPDLRIGIASYDLEMARRWGREIRNDIKTYDGEDGILNLGLRVRRGDSGAGSWKLSGSKGGVFCVGVAGGLTGKPLDLLIIDDPVKGRDTADSDRLREIAWNFWTSTARTRLAPGAPVVIIQTRWHEEDLSGRLLAQAQLNPTVAQWRVISIPAQCEKPEGDPLGRAEGEYMISAREGREHEWEEIKAAVGSRDWAALYQQAPAPAEGNILLRQWWKFYDLPRAVSKPDGTRRCVMPGGRLIQSWDMAFKDTDASDFVVGQVWWSNGVEACLLDQVRRRMDFTATKQAVRELSARWPQAKLKLVEDKANGPAVITSLKKVLPGVVPFSPKDSKQARAYAVAPFCEAGNVWLPSPELAPWVGEFVDECAGFPNAAHDDQVDAFTQALTRLFLSGGSANTYMESLLRERGVTVLSDRRAARDA